MANANLVNLDSSYMMEIVSKHAQMDITETIEYVTHVILTVKPASVELMVNVTLVLKDSSLQPMDTLVLKSVKIMNMETPKPDNVNHVMDHAVLAMDQAHPTVHLVVMKHSYLELNV